jgi:hypothetical protein
VSSFPDFLFMRTSLRSVESLPNPARASFRCATSLRFNHSCPWISRKREVRCWDISVSRHRWEWCMSYFHYSALVLNCLSSRSFRFQLIVVAFILNGPVNNVCRTRYVIRTHREHYSFESRCYVYLYQFSRSTSSFTEQQPNTKYSSLLLAR